MKHLAAGGFKDITRIASSSPTMWQHICLQNGENLVGILDEYIQMLAKAKAEIQEGSEHDIYDLFETSKNYRNSIPGGSSGPIKRMRFFLSAVQIFQGIPPLPVDKER